MARSARKTQIAIERTRGHTKAVQALTALSSSVSSRHAIMATAANQALLAGRLVDAETTLRRMLERGLDSPELWNAIAALEKLRDSQRL